MRPLSKPIGAIFMTNTKRRIKNKETGQWVKEWPDQRAKPAPGNKALNSAPENKASAANK